MSSFGFDNKNILLFPWQPGFVLKATACLVNIMPTTSILASQELAGSKTSIHSSDVWVLCDKLIEIVQKDKGTQFAADIQKSLILVLLEGANIKAAAKKDKEKQLISQWMSKFIAVVDVLVTFSELQFSFDWDFLQSKLLAFKDSSLILLKSLSKITNLQDEANNFFAYFLNEKLWSCIFNQKECVLYQKELIKSLQPFQGNKY